MANRDVNLVIRARDEATKAFQSVTSAIEELARQNQAAGSNAAGAGADFSQMASSLLSLDKALATVNGKYDAATSGLARQASEIADYQRQLAAMRGQMDSAAQAAERLRTSIVQTTLDGGDTRPLVAKLNAVETEMAALSRESLKLERDLAKSQSGYSQNAVALGDMERGLRSLGSAATFAKAESDKVTQSLRNQERAAQEAAQVLGRVNQNTGVTAPSATDNGASFEALAAREIAAQERREEAARAAAAAVRASVEASTGVTGTRAIDNGATFSALNQREAAGELKAAADAHAAFEARVKEGVAEMNRAAAAAAKEAAAINKLRDELDPLAAIQAKASAEAETLAEWRRQGKISAEEEAAALALLNKQQQEAVRNSNTPQGEAIRSREAASLKEAAAAHAAFEARVKEGVAEMRRAEEAAKEEAAAIAQLKAQLDPVATVQARLSRETEKLTKWQQRGEISAEEHAAALKLLRAEADRAIRNQGLGGIDSKGRPSFLGLKPNELTNLSYQINDVFTQIASGTSVTQTLAQQGGQILQIFPRAGAAIAGALSSGPVLALVASIALLIASISRAVGEAEKLKSIQASLDFNVDGASQNARTIADAATELDRYGASAEEALASVRTFMKEGIADGRMEEFGRAAKDTADILGTDLADASERVAKAFTGSYDAVKELDDSLNFLTATQRREIQTLFDEGRAAEARNRAFEIYAQKAAEVARDQRGPYSDAARSLANAWDDLLDAIGDSDLFESAARDIDIFGRSLSNLLRGVRDAAAIKNEIAVVQNAVDDINAELADGKIDVFGLSQWQLDRAQEKLESLNTELATLNGQRKDSGPLLAEQQEARAKQTEDLERQTEAAAELTSEEQVRTAALREANKFIEENFKLANDEAKAAYRRQAVEEKITDFREKQAAAAKKAADEARREAEERRKAAIEAIQNNTREGLVDTAQRYNGFNENNASQRGQLMEFFKSQNINVDPKMVAWCAAFVNAVLGANGLPGTNALNARSFLNYGSDATNNPQEGDIVVLKRGDSGWEGHVGFFQGFDQRGNVRVLGGNQGDGVNTQSFAASDVLGIRRAPTTGDVAADLAKADAKRVENQQNFNELVEAENLRRESTIRFASEQQNLEGLALIDAQKRQFVEEAVATQKAKAVKDELTYTADQEAATRRLAEQEFEVTRGIEARKKVREDELRLQRESVDNAVSSFQSQQQELQNQITFLRDNGQGSAADALLPQMDAVNLKLAEAIRRAQAFYEALGNNPTALEALGLTRDQIDAIVLGLDNAALSTQRAGQFLGVTFGQIAQTATANAVSAIDRFSQAIAEGSNVMSSLRDAFLQFASDFLRQIAQMILQQIIFNAISGALGGAGGAGAGVAHGGGIVGALGTNRTVSPSWFTNAMRYHSGGIAGLRPDEVPAILQRGEEVLTREDPRHRLNGGAGGGEAPKVTVVNTLDPSEFISKGLGTRKGDTAVLNWMRANSGAVRQAISGS